MQSPTYHLFQLTLSVCVPVPCNEKNINVLVNFNDVVRVLHSLYRLESKRIETDVHGAKREGSCFIFLINNNVIM